MKYLDTELIIKISIFLLAYTSIYQFKFIFFVPTKSNILIQNNLNLLEKIFSQLLITNSKTMFVFKISFLELFKYINNIQLV